MYIEANELIDVSFKYSNPMFESLQIIEVPYRLSYRLQLIAQVIELGDIGSGWNIDRNNTFIIANY